MQSELVTRLADAEEKIRLMNAWHAETQMNAHQWMVAHDCLKAGKPYTLPKPADLPEAVERLHKEVAMCRAILSDCREAIRSLDDDAFGMVVTGYTDADTPIAYPVRDELLSNLDAALTADNQEQQ